MNITTYMYTQIVFQGQLQQRFKLDSVSTNRILKVFKFERLNQKEGGCGIGGRGRERKRVGEGIDGWERDGGVRKRKVSGKGERKREEGMGE